MMCSCARITHCCVCIFYIYFRYFNILKISKICIVDLGKFDAVKILRFVKYLIFSIVIIMTLYWTRLHLLGPNNKQRNT